MAKQSKLEKAKALVVKDLTKVIDKVKKAKTANHLDDLACEDALSSVTYKAIDAACAEEENA